MTAIEFIIYLRDRGRHLEGIRLCDGLISCARDRCDDAFLGRVLNTKGVLLKGLCRFDEAERCFMKAMEVDRNIEYKSLANLSMIRLSLGKPFTALEMIERSLELWYRHPGFGVDDTLSNEFAYDRLFKGDILLSLGRVDSARDIYLSAYQVFEENEDHKGKGMVFLSTSRMFLKEGSFSTALHYSMKALDSFFLHGGFMEGESSALKTISFILLRKGERKKAEEILSVALKKDRYMRRKGACEFSQLHRLVHGNESYHI